MTWHELETASVRFARHLLDLGLRPGDRIASLMPNRPALLVHYLACMKAGLVATPLNYRCQPPEMDHALAVSGASAIPPPPSGRRTYGLAIARAARPAA
jgi:acyl-CoA synthetase (AMP-forming)/AMP-acid ligase II